MGADTQEAFVSPRQAGFISCDQEFPGLLWQPGISGQVSDPGPVTLGWGRECLNLPDA